MKKLIGGNSGGRGMVVVGLMLFASGLAEAATYYVSPNGGNASPYDTWDKAAADIATVLPIADDGDVIRIDSSATFSPTEALTVSKGVALCGWDRETDAASAATFDGSGLAGS